MFSSSFWPAVSVFVGRKSEKLLTPFDLQKNVAFFYLSIFFPFHFLTGGQTCESFKGRPNPISDNHKCPAIMDTFWGTYEAFRVAIKSVRYRVQSTASQLLIFPRMVFPIPASFQPQKHVHCVHPSLQRCNHCTLPTSANVCTAKPGL